ncbi:dipeptidase E [Enterococcus sp. DIV2402]|uniref:Dipeptidase E n=1 Tax=Candidatus Enterococcus lowellii TaxID=2230877 RepID=A0ABZ2SSF9_9ENTE|nr:Type 1 glutamine amidotransferase-like domain-containing protein [Enterococcus sp. DIV2402]MBO0463870.1 Type 1 glutamine amidotransferase-like domain-containing protein [Enterococcus sp. DIV2402]
MKNLFLVSSFEEVSTELRSFNRDLVEKTVTFIPTASNVEKVTFYVESGQKALEKMGLIVDHLDVSTAKLGEIKKKLQENDCIYVTGGNSFFLLQELKKSGADQVIIEEIQKGKIYIGESAGAIVLSETIEYVRTMDDPKKASSLNSFSGLNVVDFYTLPHYKDIPFSEVTIDIEKQYKEQLNFCFIKNNEGIIVEGNHKRIVKTV